MKNLYKNIGFISVCMLAFTGIANAEGIFQIGPQIGFSKTDVSLSAGRASGEIDMEGVTVGVIARYTVSL